MPTYHLHAPRPTREQALRIPMYTRSGKQVLQVVAVNNETKRAICRVEASDSEHTYDICDLIHHYGQAGVRKHLEV